MRSSSFAIEIIPHITWRRSLHRRDASEISRALLEHAVVHQGGNDLVRSVGGEHSRRTGHRMQPQSTADVVGR